MSSFIIGKADDNASEIIQQLEEMYQVCSWFSFREA